MSAPTVTAEFEHDCDECGFIGHIDGCDIYWHPWHNDALPGQWVVRRSSEGGDYVSASGRTLDFLLQYPNR